MKIALGTAQLDSDYGINRGGSGVSDAEFRDILAFSEKNQIHILDTAPTYDSAHLRIGRCASNGWKVVSKIKIQSMLRGQKAVCVDIFKERIETYLSELGVEGLYGLLVHDCDSLLQSNASDLVEVLTRLKDFGLIKRLGVSLYDKNQFDSVLKLFTPDLVQVPVSILDQRILKSSALARAKEKGIEIHARSVFLQGLVFGSNPVQRKKSPILLKRVEQIRSLASAEGKTLGQFCLGFVTSSQDVDYAVVGVDSLVQLEELISGYTELMRVSDFEDLGIDNANIVDPRTWL